MCERDAGRLQTFRCQCLFLKSQKTCNKGQIANKLAPVPGVVLLLVLLFVNKCYILRLSLTPFPGSFVINQMISPPSTANLHLPPARSSLVHIETNGPSLPGSRLSTQLLTLPSRSSMFSWVEEPARRPLAEPRQRHRDARADSSEAQTGGGRGAQGERHEVPLRVRGALSWQHPGGLQHRNQQDAACGGGRLYTVFNTELYRGWGGGCTPYRASNHSCFHTQCSTRLHSRGGGGEACGSVGVSELESTHKPLVRRCQTWVLLSNGCSTPTLLHLINNTRPQSEPQMSQITLSPQTAIIFSTFLRIYLPFSGWNHLANQLTCQDLVFFCLVSQIQGPIDHLKKVTVTVSLVTKDPPHRPHPHCLVGKDCPEGSGICMVIINPQSNRRHRCCPMSSTRLRLMLDAVSHASVFCLCSFANLGIQCVRRKELDMSLQKRRSQNIDPFQSEWINTPTVSRSADLPDDQPLFPLSRRLKGHRGHGHECRASVFPVWSGVGRWQEWLSQSRGVQSHLWQEWDKASAWTNLTLNTLNYSSRSLIRSHHDITAEDHLLEPVQRFLCWEDGDLHAVWQSAERSFVRPRASFL